MEPVSGWNAAPAYGFVQCQQLKGNVMGRNVTLGIGTLIIILIVVALIF